MKSGLIKIFLMFLKNKNFQQNIYIEAKEKNLITPKNLCARIHFYLENC